MQNSTHSKKSIVDPLGQPWSTQSNSIKFRCTSRHGVTIYHLPKISSTKFHGSLEQWGYYSPIYASSSYVASSTKWFCQRTLTSRMVLSCNTSSSRSKIYTRYSTYDRSSINAMCDKFAMYLYNIKMWNTLCTHANSSDGANLYATRPILLVISYGPMWWGLSFPLYPKCTTHFHEYSFKKSQSPTLNTLCTRANSSGGANLYILSQFFSYLIRVYVTRT